MKFYSTNKKTFPVTLHDAVVKGLAADKGLFMPEVIRRFPPAFYQNMKEMTLREISFVVAEAFFGEEVEADQLKEIVYDALDLRRNGIPIDRHGKHDRVRLKYRGRDRVELRIERTGLACLIAGHAGAATTNIHGNRVETTYRMTTFLRFLDKGIRHRKTVTMFTRTTRNNRNFHNCFPPPIFVWYSNSDYRLSRRISIRHLSSSSGDNP